LYYFKDQDKLRITYCVVTVSDSLALKMVLKAVARVIKKQMILIHYDMVIDKFVIHTV